MTIGFFDSGIGGLTVLKEALRMLPGENYLYFADTGNVPYGTKTREDIIRFTDSAVSVLASEGAEIVVIACNTATSAAIQYLREKYTFPIIGMEPAVKPAILHSCGKKTLVTATTFTLSQPRLDLLIEQNQARDRVDRLALDRLVLFAENFEFSGPRIEDYIRACLSPFALSEYSALVLGCTHFIYFRPIFEKITSEYGIELIDGNLGTVRNLKSKMPAVSGGSGYNIRFFNTGGIEQDIRRLMLMKEWLNGK